MFETIFGDMGEALRSVVEGKPPVSLLVMAVAVVVKGLVTRSVAGVPGRAATALILMIVGLYLVYGFMPDARFSLDHWGAYTAQSWTNLMDMTGKTMLGHYLAAMVGVALVFGVRAVTRRG